MAQIKQKFNKSAKSSMVFLLASMALFGQISLVSAKSSDITADKVIRLVNEARKEAGLATLNENSKLSDAAKEKAQDMFKNNYFAHTSPLGKTPWDFILAQKYDYRYAGENLAIDYTSAKEQQQAWMDSVTHRQNILNPDYKEIGVAVGSGTIEGRKTIVTVQEFGTQVTVQNKAIGTVTNDATPIQKKEVAGLSTQSPVNTNINTAGQYTDFKNKAAKQLKLGQIFENNKLTLLGWLAAVTMAFLVAAFDSALVVYRKHKHS